MEHDIGRMARLGVCAAVLVGCAPMDDKASGTRGELGRIEFSYQGGCFFGCPLEQPLLVGTHEQIEVTTLGDVEGASVKASDPDVADFSVERVCYCERSDNTSRLEIRQDAECTGVWHKHCDNQVLVDALAKGETWLELRNKQHELVDKARVLVHEAHDASFSATLPDQLGPQHGSAFTLASGQTLDVVAKLYDADGLELLAPEGVTWHSDDAAVATLSGFLTGEKADVKGGLGVTVHGVGPGKTAVHVDVPGLNDKLQISVTK